MKIFDAAQECEFYGATVAIDTSAWLAIYGPDTRSQVAAYADYYAQLIENGNEILTNSYVVSEFFNRLIKFEYNTIFPDGDRQRYKSRRSSAEFRSALDRAKFSCEQMLQDTTLASCMQSNAEIQRALDSACTGAIDLTDYTLVELCRAKSCPLLTHDSDFRNCGISLISSNPRVLQR